MLRRAWVLLLPVPMAAQIAPRILRECAPAERCVVRVEKARSLGSADDSFDGQPIYVAEFGAGGWVVGERLNGVPLAPLRRFDASGRRTGDLGRVGQGPGEMRMPWFISAARGGSLRVWDGRSRQIEFDATGKSVLTTTARNGLMGGHSWAWVTEDEFVAVDFSPQKTGSATIHRRSWSDRLSARVELPQLLGEHRGGRLLGEVMSLGEGAFWAAEYRIFDGRGFAVARADTLGRMSVWLQYSPSWWAMAPAPAPDGTFQQVQARSTLVAALREVAPGRLVVLLAHPREPGATVKTDPELWMRTDTRVLVIDTKAGAVVGSTTIRGYPIAVTRGGLVAVSVPLEDGTAYVDLHRLRF